MTRLDDLLSYDGEEKRSRSRRPPVRWVFILIGVVVVSFLTYEFLRIQDLGTPFALVLTSVAALTALWQILHVLNIRPIPSTLRSNPSIKRQPESIDDGMRRAVTSWYDRLDYAQGEPRQFARMVRPAFVDIIEERIRFAHGVTRATDPELFREIAGPELWTFMTEPIPRRVTPQMIATWVAQMEAL
jgi:hypothetical protein